MQSQTRAAVAGHQLLNTGSHQCNPSCMYLDILADTYNCYPPISRWADDLPPKKESSFMLDWKIRKGGTNDQKVLHTGADSQQAA